MNAADLELEIYRRFEDEYAVNLRFSQPDADTDRRFEMPDQSSIRLDFAALREAAALPEKYGRLLSQQVFADPSLRGEWAEIRAVAAAEDLPVRLRLLIAPSAPELQAVRWETLADPARLKEETFAPLALDQNIVFSRYLNSADWRAVRLKPKGDLRALVMVAAPTGLESYGLPAIDASAELAIARQGLGEIPSASLPTEGSPATLNNLLSALQAGPDVDVLYLVCHGALRDGRPWLFLENDDHSVARVPGSELVQRLRELPTRPRLVVLVSCQSGGPGSGAGSPASASPTASAGLAAAASLAALGPRLVEIGIPAVLAMQDNFSMPTAGRFLPAFFQALAADGQIDRAVAAARAAVCDRPDCYVPVLFMRLKSGRLWYQPGFGAGSKDFEKFPALVRNIKRGRCTPILGSGLVEPLLGSLREVARRWSDRFHYPMAPGERDSLPQVAQFVAVNQDRLFPNEDLQESLQHYILEKFAGLLPAELAKGPAAGRDPNPPRLNRLISAVGQAQRQRSPLEPHRVLAGLPLPVFITANQDTLLEDALREAGKDPQPILCPWNDEIEPVKTIFDREPDYEPIPERPVVFHLFGSWDEPASVVLTEDHFFDFLIGITQNNELIPEQVRKALVGSSLLFLGFQTYEWNFRIIFRSLIAKPGSYMRNGYAHIAAQIEPEDGRILEPSRARRYLEEYFAKGAASEGAPPIDTYWGSPEEFMAALSRSLAGR